MKEESALKLSPNLLVSKLNEQAWFRPVFGDGTEFAPVMKFEYSNETLTIDHYTITNPVIILTRPNEILIKESRVRREQRKKTEGGGWREVPYTALVLRLVDKDLAESEQTEAVHRKEEQQRQKEEHERQEAARKIAEAERKEEEGRQCVERGVQFLATINEKYRGKKLAADQPIRLEGHSMILQFDDGETLRINIHDGSDWYPTYFVINETDTNNFLEYIPEQY